MFQKLIQGFDNSFHSAAAAAAQQQFAGGSTTNSIDLLSAEAQKVFNVSIDSQSPKCICAFEINPIVAVQPNDVNGIMNQMQSTQIGIQQAGGQMQTQQAAQQVPQLLQQQASSNLTRLVSIR